MAGLGATLNSLTIGQISAALTVRGTGVAQCRLDGIGGIPLELVVRGVIPAIPRVIGEGGEDETIAAFAVDGIASVSQLDGRYAEEGATGLVVDGEPYAVILADAERAELVLARGGEGPGLYYAPLGEGWVAASEPGALLAAGVCPAPDPVTVERFVREGACDDTAATFFADIRRVEPWQAVVLGTGGAVRVHPVGGGAAATGPVQAMRDAVTTERVGIRLTAGAAGAAVLASALEAAPRSRPLPVHSATFPGLGGAFAHTPAVLVPLPYGAVQPTVHSFAPESMDLDGFLRDVGEPVPDPDAYLLWAIARSVAGEIDTLVDSGLDTASATGCGWFARLSDRLRARYGVTVRRPLRVEPGDDEDLRDELQAVAARVLPPAAVRYASAESSARPTEADLLLPLRADLAATFMSEEFAARPWNDRVAVMANLRELSTGRRGDAGDLMRRYLVERWLATLAQPSTEDHERPAPQDVSMAAVDWSRVPVQTERFVPGDPLAAKAAWHVSTALADLTSDKTYSAALRSPWLAVMSGKPVSVSQRRFSPLWDVSPGAAARVLSRFARRRLPRLGDPWTMQVAIAEGGLARVAAGALAARLGLWHWYARLVPPAAMNVFAPRPDAVAPGDSAVVRAPWKPDEFAAALVDALRLAIPAEAFLTLAGCAVVSADDAGARVLGYAPGPLADAITDPIDVVAALCADNPAGQADEHTPVIVAVRAPRRSAAERDVKGQRAVLRPPTRAGQSPSH